MKTFLNQHQPDKDKADIVILPVPLEKTVSFLKGTSLFPKSVLNISDQLEEYDDEARFFFDRDIKIYTADSVDYKDKDISAYLEKLKQIAAGYSEKSLVIGIGGEHTVTYSLVQAALPHKGTVISLDAHADLRIEYENTKFSHACVMRRLTEAGNKIIVIGVRAISQEEVIFAEKNSNVELYFARDIANDSGWQKLINRLSCITGDIYISVDLDGLDLSIAPGVGTPVPGGLNWWRIIDVLRALIIKSKAKLKGADVVEGITLPGQAITEMTANMIIGKIIAYSL